MERKYSRPESNVSVTWIEKTVKFAEIISQSVNKTAAISIPVTAARNGQKYCCVIVDSNDETVITKIVTLTVE